MNRAELAVGDRVQVRPLRAVPPSLHYQQGTVQAVRVPPADAVVVMLDTGDDAVPFLPGDLVHLPATPSPARRHP